MDKNRIEKAAENHKSGYNCAQALACAYSQAVGMDEKTVYQLTSGLGVGMGSMEGSCGAVAAAVMIAGMKAQQAGLSKRESFRLCSQISKEFINRNKSLVCKELKGTQTGNILRDCHGCVIDAAEILEEAINGLE
ncbi:C-GCAxxG-C-C family protein [Lachnospiraceae bacterium NSJ-143]|nr:C-GCAxxG-C-C family protein [Lachnospiraceae bacterium NSJ-143]